MTNADAYMTPVTGSPELARVHTIKVMSTKTNTTIYTFKVAQTSPERALAFVTDQLGLVGSKNYKICVGKVANVYMPRGG